MKDQSFTTTLSVPATPDEVFAGLVAKAANAVTSQNAEGVRYGT